MMGREELSRYEEHGLALVEDGHREGSMLLELVEEVRKLLGEEWSYAGLHDALDTVAAFYLVSEPGREKGLSGTTVLELIEWSRAEFQRDVARAEGSALLRARARVPEPGSCRPKGGTRIVRQKPPSRLPDNPLERAEPDPELLARAESERELLPFSEQEQRVWAGVFSACLAHGACQNAYIDPRKAAGKAYEAVLALRRLPPGSARRFPEG
jgi:hypothetical protein